MPHESNWFFDPITCPSCRAPLPAPRPGLTCPQCAVALTSPTGIRLADQLRLADRTLAQLRRERVPAAAAPAPRPAVAPFAAGTPQPGPAVGPRFAPSTFPHYLDASNDFPPPARPKRPLPIGPAAILLGLGGLCLVVAAIVFLSMSWTALTLGAKVAVLGGVTGLLGALAGLATRKGLRGSAETLSAITFADLALDVFASRRANLLGLDAMPLHVFTALGAGLVAIVALSSLILVRPLRLVSAQVALALAATTAITSILSVNSLPTSIQLAGTVAGTGALALGLRRAGYRIGAIVAGAWTPLPWLQLLAAGIVQILEGDYATRLLHGHAWDLPLAAALALLTAAAPSVLRLGWLRTGVAATGLLAFELSVVASGYSYLPFAAALAIGFTVPLAIGFVASPVWRAAAALVGTALGTVAVPLLGIAVGSGLLAGVDRGTGVWRSTADLRLHGWTPGSTWAMVVLLVALGLTAVGQLPAHRSWIGLVALVSAVAISLNWHPAAWLAVAEWLLTAAVVGALSRRPAQLMLAAGTLALGLLMALPSDINSGWAYAAGALAGVVVARRLSDQVQRTGAELVALAQLLIATSAAAHVVSPSDGTPAVAGLLTIAAVSAIAAALSPSRRWWLWLSFAAITGAIWIEGAVHQVHAVELYCVPLGVIVLAVGHREARGRELSSWLSYAPGLLILTLPSTIMALREPLSWRAWAVGAAALALVLAGSRLKRQSPLLIGAFELGILVIREIGPYALAVPRWAAIAAVGLVLLGTGITWENRLANLQQARRRLASLS